MIHLLLVLLTALAVASRGAASDEISFPALAEELLDSAPRADAGSDPPGGDSTDTLRWRLEPLHTIVALGALELWVPTQSMRGNGKWGRGPSAKEVRPWALALVELQRLWVARTPLQAELATLEQSVDELEGWVRGFRSRKFPEPTPESRAAVLRIASEFLAPTAGGGGTPRLRRPIVILLCPTRTHYAACLGVLGQEMSYLREELWCDGGLRSSMQTPDFSTAFFGMTWAPSSGEGALLIDTRPDEATQLQSIVHLASLMLGYNHSLVLDGWFLEALAICDTVDVVGRDDTVFSGHRSSDWERTVAEWARTLGIELLENSPYRRGASEDWFVRELKKAYRKRSFEILDMSDGRLAERVFGPFLGGAIGLPEDLADAPVGVRNGFAEFFRAYSASFVHWLSIESVGGEPLLDQILRSVRGAEPGGAGRAGSRLAAVLDSEFGRTLGASEDVEVDLEAEFLRWLVGRAR